jgi:hypothetical protein
MIEANVNQYLPEINDGEVRSKKHTLCCSSCLRKLIEVVEVLDIKYEQSIKASCSCGGSSFLIKTTGKVFTKPLDAAILSIDHPFDSNCTVIKCK